LIFLHNRLRHFQTTGCAIFEMMKKAHAGKKTNDRIHLETCCMNNVERNPKGYESNMFYDTLLNVL
jgi:hypothetical protein